MAERFRNGNKLYVLGNGPARATPFTLAYIIEKRQPLTAQALPITDLPTLTAIGNDQDFSRVFVNQPKPVGRPGDIAVEIGTGGKSPNLIYALGGHPGIRNDDRRFGNDLVVQAAAELGLSGAATTITIILS